MKKELDLKEVEKILQDAANQDVEGLDKDIVVTRCLMKIAKENLLNTFTDKQLELYEKYVTAKQRYLDVIAEKSKATKK